MMYSCTYASMHARIFVSMYVHVCTVNVVLLKPSEPQVHFQEPDNPTIPRLKEILRSVGCLKPKDVLLLPVVVCDRSKRMVNANGIVGRVEVGLLVKRLLVLVQIENEVTQRHIEHLPAPLSQRSCTNK